MCNKTHIHTVSVWKQTFTWFTITMRFGFTKFPLLITTCDTQKEREFTKWIYEIYISQELSSELWTACQCMYMPLLRKDADLLPFRPFKCCPLADLASHHCGDGGVLANNAPWAQKEVLEMPSWQHTMQATIKSPNDSSTTITALILPSALCSGWLSGFGQLQIL